MNVNGYETITTFWEDFSIADEFGVRAVKGTYERAMKEWKTNYKYLTELVMVLNWKIWQHHEKNNSLAEIYNTLWIAAEDYAYENLKDDELTYFYQTTN